MTMADAQPRHDCSNSARFDPQQMVLGNQLLRMRKLARTAAKNLRFPAAIRRELACQLTG
jgi:hypothetical protein